MTYSLVEAQQDRILMLESSRRRALDEREAWMRKALLEHNAALEARRQATHWRENHNHQRNLKRKLSAEYGAIMARKPKARWRRTKKRVKRWFS